MHNHRSNIDRHATPAGGRRRMRIGLFADSPLQPRWLVEAFVRVSVSDFAEVVAIAERCAEPPATPWSWRVYGRVDRWLFGSPPDPSRRVGLKDHLPHAWALSLPDPDVEQSAAARWRAGIAALRLDVAFALGEVEDAALDGVARFGVWRYCFGAECATLEPTAGFREVTEEVPVTAAGLKVYCGSGAPERLLYQSWSRTYPFSVARNRENLLRKTPEFAVRALRELERSGLAWLERCAPLVRAPARSAGANPGGAEIFRSLRRLGGRIARRGLQKLLYVDQWFLALRFSRARQGSLWQFTRLMPPKDRYWADPFPVAVGGRYFIFFEEFMFASRKGHIAMIEVDRNGPCSAPRPVLERDYHLSYPFLAEVDGQLFMIPETGDNRTVELYRCIDFPHDWRLEQLLLRGAHFADATLHRDDDRWWMFVNVGAEGTELYDELHLFSADRLHGEWRPHRDNPVKTDVRCARPAGGLFRRDAALYRPAQICAPLYGSGISINRVLHLSPQAYVEREVERILPTHAEGLLGIHTLNRAGDLSVVDAFTRRRRLGEGEPTASAEPERLVPLSLPLTQRAAGAQHLKA